MPTTLQDITSNYSRQTPTDPFQSLQQGSATGIEAGLNLISRQQDQQRMAIQAQQYQQDMNLKSDQYAMQGFKDIGAEDDPKLRSVMAQTHIANLNKLPGGRWKVDPDYADMMKKAPEALDRFLDAANSADDLTDPQTKTGLARMWLSGGLGAPDKGIKFLNDVSQQRAQLMNTQQLVQGKQMAAAMPGWNKSVEDALQHTTDPGDIALLEKARFAPSLANDPATAQALARGKAASAMAVQQKQQDTHASTQAGTAVKEANAKAIPERVELTRQALALRGQQMGMAQQKRLESLDNDLVKNPVYNSLQKDQSVLDHDYGVIQHGMTWADVATVKKSTLRALTGGSRAALGGDKSMEVQPIAKFFTDAFGNITGNEEGGPSDAQVDILMRRTNQIRQGMSNAATNFEQKFWNTKTAQKLVDPSLAKAHFEANNPGVKFTPEAAHMPEGTKAPQGFGSQPGVPTQNKPSSQLKTMSPAAQAAALNAYGGNKQMLLDFMKRKGYDTSGVK